MRYLTLLLAVVVIGCSLSCVSRGQNQQLVNSNAVEQVTVLRPVPAVLNEETHPRVEAVETPIKGKTGAPFEFKHAQFVNESHGWAMSEHSLYRTKDGGKTWEWLSHQPEKDARFTSFYFIDESHGWLTAVKHVFTESYFLGHSSVIMMTEDGGTSWKLQASFPNEVKIRELRFLNRTEGLAIGGQVIDGFVPYDELFVLSTSNGGREWKNISPPANAAIKNEYGLAQDTGKYIEWTSSSSMLMLTGSGRVISTTDGGKTWKLIARFKDERPHEIFTPISTTGYHKLALDPAGRIRVVAAAMGDEGYWGDFVVHEDGRWTSYEAKLTPILDAVFLSDKEVLACGANHRTLIDKSNPRLKTAGVILRSFDTGKSWQTIYRSKSSETFFYLTRVKDNQFYAVSDRGTFLRFSLPQ